MVDEEDDALFMLRKLGEEYRKWDLCTKITKTRYLNPRGDIYYFSFENKIIKGVDEARCLKSYF